MKRTILVLLLVAVAVPVLSSAAAPRVRFEIDGEAGERALAACREAWAEQGRLLADTLLPADVEARDVRCLLLSSAEFDRLFGGVIRDWGIGVALPGGVVVALDCGKQEGVGPGVATVFLHEMTHALIFQAVGEVRLPTWFHEGVAQTMSGEWRFVDTIEVVMSGSMPSLNRLWGDFPSPGPWASQAYRTSLLAVTCLRDWYGEDVIPSLLAAARAEGNFDRAFIAVTSQTTDTFSSRFARKMQLRYGWLVTLTRWPTLFVLMAVFFAVGAVARIIRNRRRLAAMDEPEP